MTKGQSFKKNIHLFLEGDTGPNLIEWVRFLLGKDLQFPHIKFVYPTAPLQPYTPLDGEVSENETFDSENNNRTLFTEISRLVR